MMNCPRCKRVIPFEATSHSCGWHAGAVGQATVPCAFEGCTTPARFNVQRPQGRANVCKQHYETLASQDAAAWCEERGIHSAEEAASIVHARCIRAKPMP